MEPTKSTKAEPMNTVQYAWDDPRRLGKTPDGEWCADSSHPLPFSAFPERFPVPKPKKDVSEPHTYLVGAVGSAIVKIGYSSDPKKRLAALRTGHYEDLQLLWVQTGYYERDLHKHFGAYRIRGEWFDLAPLGDPVEAVKAAMEQITTEAGAKPPDSSHPGGRIGLVPLRPAPRTETMD